MLAMLTLTNQVLLAPLTSADVLAADVLREVALVAIGAVATVVAGQKLTDAPVLIAELRRCAGVQMTRHLPAGRTRGAWLALLAALCRSGRPSGVIRLAAAHADKCEAKTCERDPSELSLHAVHWRKMIGFGDGGKAHSRMRRFLRTIHRGAGGSRRVRPRER